MKYYSRLYHYYCVWQNYCLFMGSFWQRNERTKPELGYLYLI